MIVTLPEKRKLAKLLTEVAESKKVFIMDEQGQKVKREGTYQEIKKEWRDENIFFKRLRELLDGGKVYVVPKD